MIRIFLETGKKTTSEYVFINTLMRHVLKVEESEYSIDCVNGKDNLHNAANKFISYSEDGDVNLIIFDADSPENNGGYNERKQTLTEELQSYGIKADIFLFPNNKDDGDFESLLESLMRIDKHKTFVDCYSDYEKCLGHEYVAPNRKGKLFTYISAMPMSKTKRGKLGSGEWRFEDEEYWDLSNEYLQPLISFLERHLAPIGR